MFEQRYENICDNSVDSGQIALIPWDIETFGFPVADYKLGDSKINSLESKQLKSQLETWAKSHKVEVVGTTVAASNIPKLCFLQSLGFSYIDTTLEVCYKDVPGITYPQAQVTLRPAKQNDLQAVLDICAVAFNKGRYHADARFPKELANKRYMDWARRSFAPQSKQIPLVAMVSDRVCAFAIVQIDGQQGCIHLNAVAPQWQGKRIGIGSIALTLRYFQENHTKIVSSKISAANMAAMNLHSALGAKFRNPQILLHWHKPGTDLLEKMIEKE